MNVPLRNSAYACSSSASVFITIGPYWAVPVSWTSATCSSPNSGATRDDQLGRQALHHLVSLIARQASHSGDPSIWPGSRGSNVQDFAFNLQTVTGPGWIRPFKFTASPDDTAGERQAALDQEARGDRSRVPTACCQARKQCVLGRLVVEVEGLRIELTGKSFDLLLIDDMGFARKALPDLEIIEIEPVVVAGILHGLCLRSPCMPSRNLPIDRIDARGANAHKNFVGLRPNFEPKPPSD